MPTYIQKYVGMPQIKKKTNYEKNFKYSLYVIKTSKKGNYAQKQHTYVCLYISMKKTEKIK